MSRMIEDIVHSYIEAWNDPDSDHREKALQGLLAEDVSIVDPDWSTLDIVTSIAAIGEARGKLGDLIIQLNKVISSHHDVTLFTWLLKKPDSPETLASGYTTADIVDGRIKRCYNFFG